MRAASLTVAAAQPPCVAHDVIANAATHADVVRAVVIARARRAFVVFASFAGPAGNGYPDTAGTSAIYSPDGLALARTGTQPGDVARVNLRSAQPGRR